MATVDTHAIKFDLPLIKHEEEGNIIHQRMQDGYVNATAMCKATGKRLDNYFRLDVTKDFLKALSEVIGLPVRAFPHISATALVCTIQGGIPELQGTWVHPQVAIHLGQWLSPKFAVKVSQWVFDWIYQKTPRSKLPYHLKRYMDNMRRIPIGYFSVLQEMTIVLIAPLEQQGYDIPSHIVPDISEGLLFAKWLRDKGIDTDKMPTYLHRYEDGREYPAKMYPTEHLKEFRLHVAKEWLPKRAKKYFEERDKTALPHLTQVLELNAQYTYELIE